jgi:hypothetical protein
MLNRQAKAAWIDLSREQLIEELQQIQQFVLLYPRQGEKGPDRAAYVLAPHRRRRAPLRLLPALPRRVFHSHTQNVSINARIGYPIASTTTMHPFGMASIAARVERGDEQDSGVARSSGIGMNRMVNAGPASRGEPGRNGRQPRVQTLRRLFFSRIAEMVAVVAPDTICTTLVIERHTFSFKCC